MFGPEELLSLWITLRPASTVTSHRGRSTHSCATDHIRGWDNLEKKFPTLCRPSPTPFSHVYSPIYILPNAVNVTLTPCPFNPSGTLSLDLSMSSMSFEDSYSSAKEYLDHLPEHITDSEHIPDPDTNHPPPLSGFRIFHQSNGSHFRPLRFAMIRENHAYCFSTTDPTDRRGRPRPCITKGCVTLVFRCDDDWERCFADLEVLAYDESVMEWIPTGNGQVPPARRPISAGCDDDGRALYYALGELNGGSVVGVTAEHLVWILSHDPLEVHTY